MSETIDERVSVTLFTNHVRGSVAPSTIWWRGRRYTITNVGLHYVTREGRTLYHWYAVTDGTTFFKLRFDTDTLTWQLAEVDTTN